MREKLLEELLQYAGEDKETGDEIFLLSLLDDAAEEVCNIMYPYGFRNDSQMQSAIDLAYSKYGRKIKKIAEYHYDKRGKEGVIGFSESGTSASYEASGTPHSYLKGIVPIAQIV